MNKKSGAIFFDRDGIVNERIMGGYVQNIEQFVFHKEFFRALKIAKEKAYKAILITNQQGVGKGMMTEEDLEIVHKHMQDKLKANINLSFDDIYYCTDLAGSGSKRRKPAPGMLLEAIKEHNLDIDKCWFVGDSITDVEAGNRINMNTIFVNRHWGYSGKESPTIHLPRLDLLEGFMNFLPDLRG